MNSCAHCQSPFEIFPDDLQFYAKMDVPEPTLCPDCRHQRRLAWRNEYALFRRKCDLCHKDTVSVYPEKTDFPVYCVKCWWSDGWDPLKYGRDFDFNRPFFDQYAELQKVVPRMALMQMNNENSDYTNCVSHLKNCYMLFSADFDENCMYGVWIENSKNCIDNIQLDRCELSYENVFTRNIYNSYFIYYSNNCSDSAFLLDCKNCSHCLMCWGLRNKEYHIANKPYSKEEYFQKLKEYPMSSYGNLMRVKKHFFELAQNAIRPDMRRGGTVTDSTGDYMTNAQNCFECYNMLEAKDCRYTVGALEIKDAMDCSWTGMGELGYENCECYPMPYSSVGTVNSYTGADLRYCDTCMNNTKNCLGCISLKHGEYSILNKKYTKEEYGKTLPKIIEHMKKGNEYGEFFPIRMSPFPYNITEANEDFPLPREEVIKNGFQWLEKDRREYKPQSYKIPDSIKDISDDIVKEILACEECGKNYKIVIQELALYRQIGMPVPRLCFDCRHRDRLALRNPRKLYNRKCMKCQKAIRTTYAPERTEKVYCEECYLKEVY